MEGIKLAIEKAKVVKIIQGTERRRNVERHSRSHGNGDSHSHSNEKFRKNGKEKKKNKFRKGIWKGVSTEYWQCGKTGHYRSECPEGGKGNSTYC